MSTALPFSSWRLRLRANVVHTSRVLIARRPPIARWFLISSRSAPSLVASHVIVRCRLFAT